ncbi:MAG TPA: hypothetical protein VFC77_10725 [Myxococcota bacterium]|nr:hypothetical protein [Myxococcota bacterium]
MYRRYLNARSPLRLLEQGLHGGLGEGNLGVVVAAHGVGKTPFLVGVALDELLRGGSVLHACCDQTLGHVRAHYDTVFEELAATTQLEDEATTHAEIDRRRAIRVYAPGGLSVAKLREAALLEAEGGTRVSLVVVEGLDLGRATPADVQALRSLARELKAEVWLSASCDEERPAAIPPAIARLGDAVSVVLALEPSPGAVRLRALKDHDNPDVSTLHVALDPRTLLLIRT